MNYPNQVVTSYMGWSSVLKFGDQLKIQVLLWIY